MKGTPNKANAEKLVEFMGRPDNQAKLPKYVRYGVTSAAAAPLVDKSLMAELPTNPDILKQAFAEDPKFWIDNGDKLAERWTQVVRDEVIDGAPVDALTGRARARQAGAAGFPLAAFLLVFFVAPLAWLLSLAVREAEVPRALPRTLVALQAWQPTQPVPDAAYAALQRGHRRGARRRARWPTRRGG